MSEQSSKSPITNGAWDAYNRQARGSEKYIMTDERLRSAIVNLHSQLGRKHRGSPLWSLVGNIFGHGSGVSAQICRQVGLDPHQPCGKAYLDPVKGAET